MFTLKFSECLIAKILRMIMQRIFAGSFAKKRGFSRTNPAAPLQNPYGFCSVYFSNRYWKAFHNSHEMSSSGSLARREKRRE